MEQNESDKDYHSPLKNSNLLAFSVGTVLQGQSVHIEDETGNIITQEATLGQIVVQGDSVALGYITLDSQGLELESFNGMVKTGDLGFIKDNKLYILERMKNVIIRNGENYYSHDLENQISRKLGISDGKIAVFEEELNSNGDIVSLIEVKSQKEAEEYIEILSRTLSIDLPINRFIFIKKGQIPKTTSGKKQHFKCRVLLNQGELLIFNELPSHKGGGYS